MKLYEINEAIEKCVDMETGEIIDEAALDALKMERAEKIHNIAAWIVNLKADAKAYKERADEFTARKNAAENKAESLKRYLENNLRGEGWKDADFRVTFSKTKYVNVLDEKAIPAKWWKKPEPQLMKQEITKAIKLGESIPGVELAERQSMTVK